MEGEWKVSSGTTGCKEGRGNKVCSDFPLSTPAHLLDSQHHDESDVPRKKRKVDRVDPNLSWAAFLRDIDEFDMQYVQGEGKFAFGFVEGPLVKALRSGSW